VSDINRVNGRQKWTTIVDGFRSLGIVQNGFSGHVSLHFLDGRPTRYEVREVRQLTIDTDRDERVDCSET
jgi:hypothetical protein